MDRKVKTQQEITNIAHKLKKQGRTVASFNGSFDILHIGHVMSLKEAKSKGDVLIVLLNSDTSIKSYKGPTRPIVPQAERAEILSSLASVDYVAIFDEINPISILDKIKPDIHCNGSDWGKHCIEREIVEQNGGKIHVLKWHQGFSTTGLINKILETSSMPPVRAVFIDRDGTINDNKNGYVHSIEDFEFLPKTIRALRELSKTNYKIIIVTNQSGIGKGYYQEDHVKQLHRWLLKTLKDKGIRIDKIYYCPHTPEDDCACRKPKIGMLIEAVRDFGISLSDSWIIGDDPKDVMMGRIANVKTIKLGSRMPRRLKLEPNSYSYDLKAAVDVVLASPTK
jgi:rfaE bifunctional protein nucleotidyltransferase chain/domain